MVRQFEVTKKASADKRPTFKLYWCHLMTKLQYDTITTRLSTDTIRTIFESEWNSLKSNRWLFVERQFDIIACLNGEGLTVGQLMAVKSMMEHIEQQEGGEA
jgi:hypothetical protein